ncbi:MAG: hypothetical protein ACKO7W_13140 [Elainella sp.]
MQAHRKLVKAVIHLKMLKIRPSLCGHRIFIDKKEVARATFNLWSFGGKLIIQKKTLKIAGRGFPILNRYELRQGKTCVASMTLKMLLLPPSQVLEYNHQVYVWQNSRILHENRELGLVKVRRLGPWIWSSIEVELPETLPLISQLFIVWRLLDRHRGE